MKGMGKTSAFLSGVFFTVVLSLLQKEIDTFDPLGLAIASTMAGVFLIVALTVE